MAGYHNVTIDNTQISDDLKYLGFWTNNGSYNATNTGQTGTLSSTKDQTANVTFTFPEVANAFYYYGIRRCCGGLYAICIDCDFDSPNFVHIDAVNRSDNGQNPPVVLYSKTFDTPGVHKVTLSNQYDSRFLGGNSQLTLASFVIQVADDNSSSSLLLPSTASTTLSISPSSLIASSSISHSPTSSIAPEASQPSTTPKAPVGAIVGGVMGGITAISACFIIWFFMRRRHRTQPEHDNTNASFYTSSYRYSPFIVPRTTTPTAYTVTDDTSGRISRKTKGTSVVAGASVSNSSSGRTQPFSSPMASDSPERLPRREIDAGRIDIDDDEDDLRTLPPGYDDIFSSGHLHGEQSVARGPGRRLPTRSESEIPSEDSPSGALGQPSSQTTKL